MSEEELKKEEFEEQLEKLKEKFTPDYSEILSAFLYMHKSENHLAVLKTWDNEIFVGKIILSHKFVLGLSVGNLGNLFFHQQQIKELHFLKDKILLSSQQMVDSYLQKHGKKED